jgi:N-carbamoylputrescine amidase
MEPRIGDIAYNLKRTLEMVGDAAAAGAKLVVLPELCNTGYVFETREEAFRLAEEVPAGPTTEAWAQAAARHGLTLVAGITERDGACCTTAQLNQVLRDRRTDVYDEMLGADVKRGWY